MASMSSSLSSRLAYLLGLLVLVFAGLAFFLWPAQDQQLDVDREQAAPEDSREAANVEVDGLQRELVAEDTEAVAVDSAPTGQVSDEADLADTQIEFLQGIVYLPSGHRAPAGICVLARLRSTQYPSVSAQQTYALDPAANPNIEFTDSDGHFKFPELARSEQWYVTAGGDFMLSAESTWREFRGAEGLIPVQLCEVVGGRVEVVDQFGESLLEKISLTGASYSVQKRKSWSRIHPREYGFELLGAISPDAEQEGAMFFRALQPELLTMELQCGSSWPGYESASVDFEFDTIRNGIETHQLVMRDTGVNRGDIRFTLVGVPDELLVGEAPIFEVELYVEQFLYRSVPEPGAHSAVLRGIPLGTYN